MFLLTKLTSTSYHLPPYLYHHTQVKYTTDEVVGDLVNLLSRSCHIPWLWLSPGHSARHWISLHHGIICSVMTEENTGSVCDMWGDVTET